MAFTISYELVTTEEQLKAVSNLVSASTQSEVIALDLETQGFDPYGGRIRIISLNVKGKVYVIDLFRVGTISPLDKALWAYRGVTTGQNLVFDQKWLWLHHRIRIKKPFDTYRASNLIYNGLTEEATGRPYGHNLYDIYWRELRERPIAQELGATDWGLVLNLSKEHYDYAAEDVTLLPRLRQVLLTKLVNMKLQRVAKIEFDVIFAEARMELKGFPLDREAWLKLAAENLKKERALRVKLLSLLPNPISQLTLLTPEQLEPPLLDVDLSQYDPEDDANYIEWLTRKRPKAVINKAKGQLFNVDSSAQILKSLQMLNLRVIENGKAVVIQDTNELTLAQFAKKVPVVKMLLEHRAVATQIKMFGAPFISYVNKHTGRIHGRYYPFTGTGRYAMRTPNCQQIPKDKAFRRCFKPKVPKRFHIADFSQVELRIMAQLSKDPVLIDAYKNDIDIHRLTASIIYDCPIENIKKGSPERDAAKPTNFGFIYGLMPPTFVLYALAQYGVEMTLEQAKTFRDRFFGRYQGVAEWQRRQLKLASESGLLRTLSGRIRYLPETAHNEWFNTPDQSVGADALKIAMARITDHLDELGGGADLVHVVHDETIVEVDENEELIQNVDKIVVMDLEEALAEFVTVVPAVAEAKVGTTWADK